MDVYSMVYLYYECEHRLCIVLYIANHIFDTLLTECVQNYL